MTEPAYFTTFTGQMHTDFPRALYEIGDDRDTDTTVFSDFPHLTFGIVPGDGTSRPVSWCSHG